MASIKRVGSTTLQNRNADLFKALGYPTRLSIIDKLSTNQISCKLIQLELKIAKSTLSRHIQILYDAGIIGYDKIVNETYYFINPFALSEAANYLEEPIRLSEDQNFEDVHFKIPDGLKNPKL